VLLPISVLYLHLCPRVASLCGLASRQLTDPAVRVQVNNNKASDVHPMVDRQIFKDERKSSTEQLKALNHSVCRAILTFLNPFAVGRFVLYLRVCAPPVAVTLHSPVETQFSNEADIVCFRLVVCGLDGWLHGTAAPQKTQVVYLERVAGLGAGSAADDVADRKMMNPMATSTFEDDDEDTSPTTME